MATFTKPIDIQTLASHFGGEITKDHYYAWGSGTTTLYSVVPLPSTGYTLFNINNDTPSFEPNYEVVECTGMQIIVNGVEVTYTLDRWAPYDKEYIIQENLYGWTGDTAKMALINAYCCYTLDEVPSVGDNIKIKVFQAGGIVNVGLVVSAVVSDEEIRMFTAAAGDITLYRDSTKDIKYTGLYTETLSGLCTHEGINMWSFHKPISYNYSGVLTDTIFINENEGLNIPYCTKTTTEDPDFFGQEDKQWTYIRPSSKFRLMDFNNYESGATAPSVIYSGPSALTINSAHDVIYSFSGASNINIKTQCHTGYYASATQSDMNLGDFMLLYVCKYGSKFKVYNTGKLFSEINYGEANHINLPDFVTSDTGKTFTMAPCLYSGSDITMEEETWGTLPTGYTQNKFIYLNFNSNTESEYSGTIVTTKHFIDPGLMHCELTYPTSSEPTKTWHIFAVVKASNIQGVASATSAFSYSLTTKLYRDGSCIKTGTVGNNISVAAEENVLVGYVMNFGTSDNPLSFEQGMGSDIQSGDIIKITLHCNSLAETLLEDVDAFTVG